MPESEPGRWRFRVCVTVLVLLALGTRLTLLGFGPWQDTERALRPDSRRYVLLAENLLKYHTLGKTQEEGLMHEAVERLRQSNDTAPVHFDNGLAPDSFRTPGYPAFLAMILATGQGLRGALLIQCLSGGLATALVVSIGGRIGLGRRAALAAGFLWAIHPALVLYDNLILTESLFNFGAIAALALACRGGVGFGALSGLALGLTSLVRPVGLMYLPAVLASAWRRPRRLLTAAAVVLPALIPSAAWAARNRFCGEGLRVSSVGDLNLLFYSAAFTISEEKGEDWLQSWPKRVQELEDELRGRLQPGEDVVTAARRLALAEMRARPWLAIKVHAKSQLKLLIDHSAGDFAQVLGQQYHPTGLFSRFALGGDKGRDGAGSSQLAVVACWALLNVVIVVSAVVGLALALRRGCFRLLIVCVPTILMLMAATGCVGLERFRLPIMLPLILLAVVPLGTASEPAPSTTA